MFKFISANAGPNVEVRKRLSFQELKEAYATCRALVFTPEEDFGIVPVEANASGRPVIAYGHGGVTDSILDGKTGLFFQEQTVSALCEALQRFDQWLPTFQPEDAIHNARRFAPEVFDNGILDALRSYRPIGEFA